MSPFWGVVLQLPCDSSWLTVFKTTEKKKGKTETPLTELIFSFFVSQMQIVHTNTDTHCAVFAHICWGKSMVLIMNSLALFDVDV